MMSHWIQQVLAFLTQLFRGSKASRESIRNLPPVVAPQKANIAMKPLPLVDPQPKPESGDPPTYRKRDSLMTYQERHFYFDVLLRVVDVQYRIFSKVRLGDLVRRDEESTDPKFRTETWYKHIDFVLCDRTTLEPLLAIELDDSSHSQFDNRERDAIKDRVCDEAELPLLRIKTQRDYPIDAIGAEIRVLIQESKSAVGGTDSATS